ncbi:MAG: phage holin family protein [Candidatus Xenobium sp.]|jgi:putative membrane protein
MRLLLHWLINAVAIWAAFLLVPGIHAQHHSMPALLLLAAVFGLLNTFVRPVLKFLSCPMLILTLGLGCLLINAFMFWMTGWVASAFGVGFQVSGFFPAFFGALVVTVVSSLLHLILPTGESGEARQR